MGLFWFGVISVWGYFGLGLLWFGVILVGLFQWGYFGLGLFHTGAWLVLQLQQMKFALNGLNTVDSIEFGKFFSFSKHLDLGAYLCINEF